MTNVRETESAIRDRLVKLGRKMLKETTPDAPMKLVEPGNLSEDQFQEAMKLLIKQERYPYAFVIACIMNRQINVNKAWLIPYRLSREIGRR